MKSFFRGSDGALYGRDTIKSPPKSGLKKKCFALASDGGAGKYKSAPRNKSGRLLLGREEKEETEFSFLSHQRF